MTTKKGFQVGDAKPSTYVIVIGALAGTYLLLNGNPFAGKESATASKAAVVSSPAPSRATLPALQVTVANAVIAARSSYKMAPNELKKSAVRADRRAALEAALGDERTFENWTGTLKSMGTNSDGKAHVSIQSAKGEFFVKTWNNSLSDAGDNTLIDQSSPLFVTIAELSKGDRVVFSGEFLPSKQDWIRESSMTEAGSVEEPEFVARITDVKRAE